MGKKADLVDDALRRMRSWLAGRDEYGSEVLETLNGPPSKGELNKLGASVGGKLPEGVQAIYTRINGQSQDTNELESAGLMPAIVAEVPAFRLLEIDESIDSSPGENLLAIAESPAGDQLVVDCRDGIDAAPLLHYFNEQDAALTIADSVEAFLTQIADDLDTGAIEISEELGLHRPDAPDVDEDDLDEL